MFAIGVLFLLSLYAMVYVLILFALASPVAQWLTGLLLLVGTPILALWLSYDTSCSIDRLERQKEDITPWQASCVFGKGMASFASLTFWLSSMMLVAEVAPLIFFTGLTLSFVTGAAIVAKLIFQSQAEPETVSGPQAVPVLDIKAHPVSV
jgi:hypothetical protein